MEFLGARMICFKDKTFCGSPNCTNECGLQMTEQMKQEAIKLGLPVSYAMFCDEELHEDLEILNN